MQCSQLHCQKRIDLILFAYKIRWGRSCTWAKQYTRGHSVFFQNLATKIAEQMIQYPVRDRIGDLRVRARSHALPVVVGLRHAVRIPVLTATGVPL